jgi:hypothetical protein
VITLCRLQLSETTLIPDFNMRLVGSVTWRGTLHSTRIIALLSGMEPRLLGRPAHIQHTNPLISIRNWNRRKSHAVQMEVRLPLQPASIDFHTLTYVYSCYKVRATDPTTFQEPTAIRVWGGITVSIQTVLKIDAPEGRVFHSLQRWLRLWVLQDFPFFLGDENVIERERERR